MEIGAYTLPPLRHLSITQEEVRGELVASSLAGQQSDAGRYAAEG